MSSRKVIALSLGFLLAVPAVAAWGSKGDNEPNSVHDVDGGFMFTDTDVDPDQTVKKVYFNGWAGTCGGYVVCTSGATNPNFAQLGSAIQGFPYQSYAMLGVWKDCDKDGYVGHGDNLLVEYPVALLPEDHVCPASREARAHNDGQWVHEFIPIGWSSATPGQDNYFIADDGARVWSDWNLPTDAIDPTCAIAPQPVGTWHSTGGIIFYADCVTNRRIENGVNTVAGLAGLPQISFADSPGRPDRSGSLLNQKTPLGDASDPAFFSATDCGSNLATVPTAVTDPTDPGDGSGALHQPGGLRKLTNDKGELASIPVVGGAEVSGPSPSGPNAGGSVLGTVNETENDALAGCDRSTGSVGDDAYCPQGGLQNEFCEDPEFQGQELIRRQPDHVLYYNQVVRGNDESAGGQTVPVDSVVGPGARSGVVGAADPRSDAGFWTGNDVTGVSRNPYVSRADLGPETVTYATFYGYVSPTAVSAHGLTLKVSTAGSYGSAACVLGPASPFDCNPANWWKNARGESINPTSGDGSLGNKEIANVGAVVGDPFNVLDIDCYDGSVAAMRDAGVTPFGLATGTFCE